MLCLNHLVILVETAVFLCILEQFRIFAAELLSMVLHTANDDFNFSDVVASKHFFAESLASAIRLKMERVSAMTAAFVFFFPGPGDVVAVAAAFTMISGCLGPGATLVAFLRLPVSVTTVGSVRSMNTGC